MEIVLAKCLGYCTQLNRRRKIAGTDIFYFIFHYNFILLLRGILHSAIKVWDFGFWLYISDRVFPSVRQIDEDY